MSQPTDSAGIEQQMALVNPLTQAFAYVINCHGDAVNQAQQGGLSVGALQNLVDASINLLEASQWALKMALCESETLPKPDAFTLTSSDRNALGAYMKQITTASSAIASSASLLFKFVTDDDCGDKIPAEVKSNNIRSGLLESIMVANDRVLGDVDSLERRIEQPAEGGEGQGGAL